LGLDNTTNQHAANVYGIPLALSFDPMGRFVVHEQVTNQQPNPYRILQALSYNLMGGPPVHSNTINKQSANTYGIPQALSFDPLGRSGDRE
jgi:hypothetical protein